MRVLAAVVLAAVLEMSASAAPGHACPTDADYGAAGPYGVGVRTLTLVDTRRTTPAHADVAELPQRTLKTEVWYPTTAAGDGDQRDAPLAAGGPFPLVVNSPGLRDNSTGERYYARHLASRGFVVASLDFPLTNTSVPVPVLTDLQHQPGDVSFVMDQVLAATGETAWLAGGVDAKRIGVSGLSLGGATTLLVTYHPEVRDRRVRAALAIAPAGGCAATPALFHVAHPPLLVLGGDQDLLVPFDENGAKVFRLSRSPRTLVTLQHASHTSFSGFVTFDSQVSYDTLVGCAAIADVALWGDPFTGLTGSGTGFKPNANQCVAPCTGPAPTNPPMQASVQHALTRQVVAAFFEGTLGRSADARCFLRRRLAAENPVVTVQTRPGR